MSVLNLDGWEGVDEASFLSLEADTDIGMGMGEERSFTQNRGHIMDFVHDMYVGITEATDLIGGGFEVMGIDNPIRQWSEKMKDLEIYKPDAATYYGTDSWGKKIVHGITQSAPATLAPIIAGLGGAAVAGPAAGVMAGTGTMLQVFGAGTYAKALDEGGAQGLKGRDLEEFAWNLAISELASEFLGTGVTIATGGLAAPIVKALSKGGSKGILKALKEGKIKRNDIMREVSGQIGIPKTIAFLTGGATVEGGTEVINSLYQNYTRDRFGLQESDENLLDTFAIGFGLGGGISVGANVLTSPKNRAVKRAYENALASKDPDVRIKAYEDIASKLSPELRQVWTTFNEKLQDGPMTKDQFKTDLETQAEFRKAAGENLVEIEKVIQNPEAVMEEHGVDPQGTGIFDSANKPQGTGIFDSEVSSIDKFIGDVLTNNPTQDTSIFDSESTQDISIFDREEGAEVPSGQGSGLFDKRTREAELAEERRDTERAVEEYAPELPEGIKNNIEPELAQRIEEVLYGRSEVPTTGPEFVSPETTVKSEVGSSVIEEETVVPPEAPDNLGVGNAVQEILEAGRPPVVDNNNRTEEEIDQQEAYDDAIEKDLEEASGLKIKDLYKGKRKLAEINKISQKLFKKIHQNWESFEEAYSMLLHNYLENSPSAKKRFKLEGDHFLPKYIKRFKEKAIELKTPKKAEVSEEESTVTNTPAPREPLKYKKSDEENINYQTQSPMKFDSEQGHSQLADVFIEKVGKLWTWYAQSRSSMDQIGGEAKTLKEVKAQIQANADQAFTGEEIIENDRKKREAEVKPEVREVKFEERDETGTFVQEDLERQEEEREATEGQEETAEAKEEVSPEPLKVLKQEGKARDKNVRIEMEDGSLITSNKSSRYDVTLPDGEVISDKRITSIAKAKDVVENPDKWRTEKKKVGRPEADPLGQATEIDATTEALMTKYLEPITNAIMKKLNWIPIDVREDAVTETIIEMGKDENLKEGLEKGMSPEQITDIIVAKAMKVAGNVGRRKKYLDLNQKVDKGIAEDKDTEIAMADEKGQAVEATVFAKTTSATKVTWSPLQYSEDNSSAVIEGKGPSGLWEIEMTKAPDQEGIPVEDRDNTIYVNMYLDGNHVGAFEDVATAQAEAADIEARRHADKQVLKRQAKRTIVRRKGKGDVQELVTEGEEVHGRIGSGRITRYKNAYEFLSAKLDSLTLSREQNVVLNSILKIFSKELKELKVFTTEGMIPGMKPSTLGAYYTKAHQVGLREDALSGHQVVHELVHAVTTRRLSTDPTYREDIMGLYKDYVRSQGLSFGQSRAYAHLSLHEFVAEGLSNPKFQELISNIPSSREQNMSVWQVLQNLVKSLFGKLENSPSVLDSLYSYVFNENVEPIAHKTPEMWEQAFWDAEVHTRKMTNEFLDELTKDFGAVPLTEEEKSFVDEVASVAKDIKEMMKGAPQADIDLLVEESLAAYKEDPMYQRVKDKRTTFSAGLLDLLDEVEEIAGDQGNVVEGIRELETEELGQLYHGSRSLDFDGPPKPTKVGDFGTGFYTTTSKKFAEGFRDLRNFAVRTADGFGPKGSLFRTHLDRIGDAKLFGGDTPLTQAEKDHWNNDGEDVNHIETHQELMEEYGGRNFFGELWVTSAGWNSFLDAFGYDLLAYERKSDNFEVVIRKPALIGSMEKVKDAVDSADVQALEAETIVQESPFEKQKREREEKEKEKAKQGPKTEAEYDTEVQKSFEDEDRTPLGQIRDASVSGIEKVTKAVKELFQPISDAILFLDEKMAKMLDAMDAKSTLTYKRYVRNIQPFINTFKEMTEEDKRKLSMALYNGKQDIVKKMLPEDVWKGVEATLRELDMRARGVGLVYDKQKGLYFPRRVKDVFKFLDDTRENAVDNALFAKAFEEYSASKGGIELTQADKAFVVSEMLRSGQVSALPRPGASKERSVPFVSGDTYKHYGDAASALVAHIFDMNEKLSAREFVGGSARAELIRKLVKKNKAIEKMKDATEEEKALKAQAIAEAEELIATLENEDKLLEDSINLKIIETAAGLDARQAQELMDLLKARLRPKGAHGAIDDIRNIGYITTMGNFLSAITQLGDIPIAVYANGLNMDTMKALAQAFKNIAKVVSTDINKKTGWLKEYDLSDVLVADMDFTNQLREFSHGSYTSNMLETVFKYSGLKYTDLLGKEAFLQASAAKMKRMDNDEFIERYGVMFGDDAQLAVTYKDDIRSDYVKIAAFSELAKWQPISMSQQSKAYVQGGNARIFYMLKTFTMRATSAAVREGLMEYNQSEGTALDKAKMAKRIGSILLVYALAGATIDQLKDILKGKEQNITDSVIDNLLSMFLIGKFNAEMGLQRDQLITSIVHGNMPPLRWLDQIGGDLYSVFSDDKEMKMKSLNMVPLVGNLIYNYSDAGRATEYKYRKESIKENLKKAFESGGPTENIQKDIHEYNDWARANGESTVSMFEMMTQVRRDI